MASGTTLTIDTKRAKNAILSVAMTDAGTPALGSPVFIYDDGETQSDLIIALDKAKMWVMQNVKKRR